MRILLCSNWFAPSIGGIETVSKLLAEEFTNAGAFVTVVTNTPGPDFHGSYKVVRQPSIRTLRMLGKQSDLIYQNLISLRTLIPLLFCRKPIVITHGSWLRRTDGKRGFENYVKLMFLWAVTNVSISRSIAKDLPITSRIIVNPFDANEFDKPCRMVRDRDIVFMGRLVSDKGCDVLLDALALLKARGLKPSVTVIGDGPEMTSLRDMATALDLNSQVEFLGFVNEGRGAIVARHRVMVIPSRWAEPFGVVALEGIAAGCAIVASEEGGLMEAVGPCGLPFPNRSSPALAEALERVLSDEAILESLVEQREVHLKSFQSGLVAEQYLEIFRELTSG